MIISGIQGSNSPSGQDPGEFVELFNTTNRFIWLKNLEIVSRTDNDADGTLDVDWQLADESPDLTWMFIAPNSFFLIGESAVIADGGTPDVVTNLDLATGEGGVGERAISIEILIDGQHMDYLLYGRHDGSDTAAVPPGDLPFDGNTFPRNEVIRNTRGTASFQEGFLRRESAEALYAGFDVEGFYTDDSPGGTGFPTGVWTSPHDQLFGAYTARSSASAPVFPPQATTTVVFQEGVGGYAGTTDTFIQENPADADNDNGNLEALGWDDDDPTGTGNDAYALIQFGDLFGTGAGQIPVEAAIHSATLTYTVFNQGDSGELHEVRISWDEGVSWNDFGGDPGASADEYDPTSVAVAPGTQTGTFNVDVTSSLQAWADDPSSNLGWIVLPTGTDGVDLRSSEYATQGERPKLTVEYLPEPGLWLQLVSGVLAVMVLDKRRRRTND